MISDAATATEVTNAQFEQFVHKTHYVTDAEKNNYGGSVYVNNEWKIDPHANWKHPLNILGGSSFWHQWGGSNYLL